MIYERHLLLRLLPLLEVKHALGLGLILLYVQFFILFFFSDKSVHVIKIFPFCYIALLIKIKDLPSSRNTTSFPSPLSSFAFS